jgi:SnoaL-like protein
MKTTAATRRSFIQTAGAALSAPLAVAAATVPASAVPVVDDANLRLAYLEDLQAIRALNQEFARHYANPGIRGITPDPFADHDVIDIGPDRQTATALIHCTVHMENEIGPSCTLVEMAKQQGGGVVRRSEAGVFEHTYVRRDGIWKIQRSSYRPM